MAVNVGTAIAYLNLDATNFNTGLANAQSALSNLNNGTGTLSQTVGAVGTVVANTGTALTRNLSIPIINLGQSSIQAARDFESAFAGVKKTIDETRFNEYSLTWDDLAQGIKDIAYETGMSTEEIAKVMEVAGQLGVELGDSGKSIIEFTRQMALMGVTTDMSAEDAALNLARFMNITGTTTGEVDGLTASIVDLGNNFATQEADIVTMATRLASAGTVAGLTAQEILALSTAMSSVNIKAEAGGSSMSTVLSKLTERVVKFGAVLNGTFEGDDSEAAEVVEAMEIIAKVSGVSAEEFYKVWTTKPIEGLGLLIKGMANAEEHGDNMILQLDELGFTQIRQSNMLRALALSYENMSDAINTANTAWDESSAMEVEAAKRFETLDSRINMLSERWKEVKRDIAEVLIPVLEKVMDFISNLIDKWQELTDEQKKSIVNLGGITAAVGPVLMFFGRLMTTVSQLMPIFTIIGEKITEFTATLTRMKWGWFYSAEEAGGFVSKIAQLGGKLNWIVAIIMLVITAIVDLWKNSEEFRDKIKGIFEKIWGFIVKLWQIIKPLIDELGNLWMELARSIEPVIELLVDLLGPALDGLISVITPILEIGTKILVLLTKIVTYAVKNLSPVIRFIVEILGGILKVVNEIISVILQLIGSVLGRLVEGLDWVINKFTEAEDTLFLMWSTFATIVNDAIHNFFDNIVNAIQGLCDWVLAFNDYWWNLFWHNNQEFWSIFQEGFSQFTENLKDIAGAVGEWLKNLWTTIKDWFVETWDSFTEWLGEAWENLYTGIQNAWDNFITWVTDVWNTFTEWIKESLSAIGEHIRQSLDAFHRWLEQMITKIKQTAERILQAIFDTAQRVWNNIVAAFERAKQHIQDGIEAVKQKFEELREAIHQKFEEIKAKIEEKFEEIKEKLENLIKMIKEKFDNLLQAIKEHFQKVFEKIKEFGQRFVNAWKEAFKNVQIGIANVFNNIRNGFQQFGSSVITIAKNVGNAFIKGLLGAGRNIKDFFVNFIKSAIEGLLSSLKAFKETGALIMKNLWEGIKSKWKEFTEWLKKVWDDFLSGELFASIWEKIKSALSGKTSTVKKTVNGSHADGLAYVPFNGYIAELHKGERVLTAAENQRYSSSGGDGTVINFYSNEKIDEYTAAKELRRTMKDFELGLI